LTESISSVPAPPDERKQNAETGINPAEQAGSSHPDNKTPDNEIFRADGKDIAFSLFAFVIGYLFVRWLLFSWRGWGVALFTLIYCGANTLYLLKKGVKISTGGWFWLAVTVLTGLSYALWTGQGLEPYRGIFLFCTAVYSVIAASGVQILGKTGNWLFLDGINAMFIIPVLNFAAQYRCIAAIRKNKGKVRKAFPVLMGVMLALIVIGIVTPLLLEADTGGFSVLMRGLAEALARIFIRLRVIQVILAVPAAAYCFGLVFGSANRRKTGLLSKENTGKAIGNLRTVPPATVYTLLGIVCAFYFLFIGTQLPYFFSAFSGDRPAGWEIYSEYARRGFFELCAIAAINLSLITAANLFSKTPRVQSRALRIFNTVLMLITLLLIGTAFSKMALYVAAYGMSMRRLLPCVFMVFLFVVCAGVIVLQKHSFSILRFAAVTGSVMFCLLCLSDPDGFTVRYNADRYLSGSLQTFDVDILYRSGSAGVKAAAKVYEQTDDKELGYALRRYIITQINSSENNRGKASDNYQQSIVRNTNLIDK